jgi:hypothetical protein
MGLCRVTPLAALFATGAIDREVSRFELRMPD